MAGMKVLLLLLLALVVAPAANPSSTPSLSAQGRARISIVHATPLVVRGVGFKAGERVTVTVAHSKTLFRRVAIAGPSGVLVARWTRSMPTTCGSTTVTARGSMGTRVVVKSVANDCARGPVDPKGSPVDPPAYPIDPQPKQP